MMNKPFNLKVAFKKEAITQLAVSSKFKITEKMSGNYVALSDAGKETS